MLPIDTYNNLHHIGIYHRSMSSKHTTNPTTSKLVLRRVAIRHSFRAVYAPEGVADFIDSTDYPHKDMLRRTMSGLFDDQITRAARPEWWLVTQNAKIVGLALVAYGKLNGEVGVSVGVEHLLVAQGHRNKGVGSKIIRGLQSLARKEDGLAAVNLESEQELIPYYRRFGFVERSWQGYGNQFVKLIWRKTDY